MYIKDKINMRRSDLEREGPIIIVALGDSITHGAVGAGEINYETVYWNRLKQKILNIRNYVPVAVINAGIGGVEAKDSIKRVDRHVIPHNPDLIIVCFGLNDVNNPLEDYLAALKAIFEKCKATDAEVVFMTPNMLNTYVSPKTEPHIMQYAAKTAEYQNSGKMDLYMNSAVKLAEEMGVEVCDCYSEWKKLSETQDTTELLANYINHPTVEMHELFADMLLKTIFKGSPEVIKDVISTMYTG